MSKGKALVTGGTGALGTSVADTLNAAGYQVHVTSMFPDEVERLRAPLKARGITVHLANMAREAEAARVLSTVGGPLSVLVSGIGGYEGGPLASVTEKGFDDLTTMNFKTAVLTLKAAQPYLKQSPGGAAVVVIGVRDAVVGGPGAALYAATKAAVTNLALSAAQEWLNDGITVNAILPSIMDTPANRKAIPDADYSKWPKTQEVADVIAFLVSDKARIVSGGAIPVYGRG